jgi:hypothetical protein
MEAAANPADRTVGQLVADSIRLYQHNFWRSLLLGLPVAVLDQLAVGSNRSMQTSLLVLATPFFTLSYIGACRLAVGQRVSRPAMLNALGVGVLVFLPVGLLVWLFVLPALAWLAVLGLSVPVALFEKRGIRESMRQARRLRRRPFRSRPPARRPVGRRRANCVLPRRPRASAAALPRFRTPVFRPESPVRVGLPTTKEARCPSTSCSRL